MNRRMLAAFVAAVALGSPTAQGLGNRPVADRTIAQSLPAVSSGARPGPDVLYAEAPEAPQLENRDARFQAPFVRVSGTEVYTGHEYLYTDHLYDDYGADTNNVTGVPLQPSAGDLSYPGPFDRFAGNAADLVEFRMAVTSPEVAYRLTLNSLMVPDSTLAVVAFDTDRKATTGSATLPRDPGAPFPGTDAALFVWGTGAEWSRWNGSAWIKTPLVASADIESNQLTVVVPRTVADPTGVWRATLAVGLHDTATGGWLAPGSSPSLSPAPPAIMNLGFRFNEVVTTRDAPPDTGQATALRARQPTTYARDIDFGALARGETRSNVPTTGTLVRFFPSRLKLGEGRRSEFPGYLGQLQPYSLYVPRAYAPNASAGLTLNLHSLSEHHWQYNGSTGTRDMGEQRGHLVATAMARGNDGWYQHEAEYDVFEMWNDVAAHYALDPDRVAITGYSMGGYATYRLGTLYPDLFGRAMSIVGPPGDGIWLPPGAPTGGPETLSNAWLESARNLPYMNIVAALDELVPVIGPTQQNIGAAVGGLNSFDALGYRFRYRVYPLAEHLTLGLLSYDIAGAVEFLGESRVDRNPAHVTLAYVPAADDPALGLVHNHAYWISDIQLADMRAGALAKAVVDVSSRARGVGDPTSTRSETAGFGPLPFTEVERTWGTPPVEPVTNTLVITTRNVKTLAIDARRAGLDLRTAITLEVDSATAATVRLLGDRASVVQQVAAGRNRYVLQAAALLPNVTSSVGPGGSLPATGGTAHEPLAAALAAGGLALAWISSARRDARPQDRARGRGHGARATRP